MHVLPGVSESKLRDTLVYSESEGEKMEGQMEIKRQIERLQVWDLKPAVAQVSYKMVQFLHGIYVCPSIDGKSLLASL